MRFFLSSFIGLSCCACLGQHYHFENYTVEEGLAQSQINAIHQDPLGYLWIGTESGLSRFDGLNFVNYSVDEGLPDNRIRQLFSDEHHHLWVATPKGIAQYVDGAFEAHLFSLPQRVDDLQTFKGKLFIATNSGLIQFDRKEKTFTPVPFFGEEKPIGIRSICNYKDSLLVIGSRTGLYFCDQKYTVVQDSTLSHSIVSDVQVVGEQLIIGTYGNGLFFHHFPTAVTRQFPIQWTSWIRSIYADTAVILCSTMSGLIEIERDKMTYFNGENGLTGDNVKCAFRDEEGNVWLGTDGSGLSKSLGKTIVSYSTLDGLSSDLIMSIAQDNQNNFIFGTYDAGFTIQKSDGTTSTIGIEEGLPSRFVWDSHTTPENETWIATSRGVVCYKDNHFLYPSISRQLNGKVRQIAAVGSSVAFAGSRGVFILQNGTVYHPEITSSLNAYTLCAVGDTLFIGSQTGLFYTTQNNQFNDLQPVSSVSEHIYALEIDRHRNLWIGTASGLKLRSPDGDVSTISPVNQTYKSKVTLGLLESQDGDIWVSTMNGVYQLSYDLPSRNGYRVKHYSSDEGMVYSECNVNALYEDSAKRIWVGTYKGLVRIDPERDRELLKVSAPKLHIRGVRLFMEPVDYEQFAPTYEAGSSVPTTIHLPYDQNHLTFDFIGLQLRSPQSVRYKYRLLGADDNWSPLSTHRSVTYPSVAPGTYDFEVMATGKERQWSPIRRMRIVLFPPFWQSWWFIVLVVSLTALIFLFFLKIRIRAIKQRQENERLAFKNRLLSLEQQSLNASMNRHFIFNSLNSIQYFINSSDKPSANKYLSSFAKLIRKNLDSSTTINFIVTLQEEIERIQLYLTLEKMRFQQKFDYQLNVDAHLDTESIKIPSMILQPYVENAIIHGVLPMKKQGQIVIRIFEEIGELVFEVTDNGLGIEHTLRRKKQNKSSHESKGMEITNRRVELLRKLTDDKLLIIGPFQMNNEHDQCMGTKVIIKMAMEGSGLAAEK